MHQFSSFRKLLKPTDYILARKMETGSLVKKLKLLDYRLLLELMKDAKRSDRQLANILGISQPTVSRKRAFLEKELIDGYTAILI